MIRKAAGFDFVGAEAKFTGYVIKCDLDHPEKLMAGVPLRENRNVHHRAAGHSAPGGLRRRRL